MLTMKLVLVLLLFWPTLLHAESEEKTRNELHGSALKETNVENDAQESLPYFAELLKRKQTSAAVLESKQEVQNNEQSKVSKRRLTIRCGRTRYNTRTQVCCSGRVVRRLYGPFTGCCRYNPYNTRIHVCCYPNVMPRRYGRWTRCCIYRNVRSIYDLRSEKCCNGRGIPRRRPCNNSCASINLKYEICCGGQKRKKIYRFNSKCCGRVVYHPFFETCCHGRPAPASCGIHSRCCGYRSYNPRYAKCCRSFRIVALYRSC